MNTPQELFISRGNQTFVVQDDNGRNLTIRRLTALDRLRLLKAAGPDLAQNEAWLNMAALAVTVVEIDGTPRPTPSNERQIEAAISELGDSALQAIADGLNCQGEGSVLFDGAPSGNGEGTPT